MSIQFDPSEPEAQEAPPQSKPQWPAMPEGPWRAIPGFDGFYEINAQGDVRSWKEWKGYKGPMPRVMKIQVRDNGTRWIQLGLHGGTWNVDAMAAALFPESPLRAELERYPVPTEPQPTESVPKEDETP